MTNNEREAIERVMFILREAYRMGTKIDEPEGNRYIKISDTLTNQMVESLARITQPNSVSTNPVMPNVNTSDPRCGGSPIGPNGDDISCGDA